MRGWQVRVPRYRKRRKAPFFRYGDMNLVRERNRVIRMVGVFDHRSIPGA